MANNTAKRTATYKGKTGEQIANEWAAYRTQALAGQKQIQAALAARLRKALSL